MNSPTLTREEEELLWSLSLYLGMRRTSILSALNLKTTIPLTKETEEDLRSHYSSYFLCLLAAIDVITQDGKTQLSGDGLHRDLCQKFSLVTNPSNADNFMYVRELRNSIAHRGLDIASHGKTHNSQLHLVAPLSVTDRSKLKKYTAFRKMLLDIVGACEAIVGPAIEAHLQSTGIFSKKIDPAVARTRITEKLEEIGFYQQSSISSDQVSEMLSETNFQNTHDSFIESLLDQLKPVNLRIN